MDIDLNDEVVRVVISALGNICSDSKCFVDIEQVMIMLSLSSPSSNSNKFEKLLILSYSNHTHTFNLIKCNMNNYSCKLPKFIDKVSSILFWNHANQDQVRSDVVD